ncbi:hypothetical protein [Pseudovibrio sp. Tun.PSC04-5.I4]|uniref:hypothetical protein n=1 Tax=Pseudovibrio sp. Tun.PSC04-5.I4 TaxID=1798213 RepID=UPI00088A3D61|nr:hypothetical protein [Pseudovibrio sp. Tun.PSC04-5.I4]SDQ13171.1 hypothetical protein SAMN04515695_0081 [Pseudovibrio sp. Tun.PSC04-5.I4]
MPHKFNAECRDNIPKVLYHGTNWHDYNESPRKHSDVTVWPNRPQAAKVAKIQDN